MGPETMAQRADIGNEKEQDGVKEVGTTLSWRVHVFIRTCRSQAMCIGNNLEGPWLSIRMLWARCCGVGLECGAAILSHSVPPRCCP